MPNSPEPIQHTAEGSKAQMISGQLWLAANILHRLYTYTANCHGHFDLFIYLFII